MAKKKTRVDMRKNRSKPPRDNQWTQEFHEHRFEEAAPEMGERVRAKGALTRKRTLVQDDATPKGARQLPQPAVNKDECVRGRVSRVRGLLSAVEGDDGKTYQCTIRRMLKTMVTADRNVVATGDIVWLRPSGSEGVIERVEPRHGVLTRDSRRKGHVLVANVDQLIIVVSLVEPALKPHLIDRYLAGAQRGGLRPLICLNKADRIDPVDYQPIVGGYAQLGIGCLLTSAVTGQGIAELRRRLRGVASVFSGQSGVGKSSLLNAVEPGLALKVRAVSEKSEKGRHTTTASELIKLECGGWVVDTPGVRQLRLYDVRAGEVEGLFPEFHPFVPLCAFPDCTHTHEEDCGVRTALARRLISHRRYTSYLGMYQSAIEG